MQRSGPRRPRGPADRGAARPVPLVVALAIGLAVAATLVGSLAGLDEFDPGTATGHEGEFDLTAEGARGAVTLEYVVGGSIAVDELTVDVAVNGDELARQPPVPFVGAVGFEGAPWGPFNAEADDAWDPGERAGFRVAETNAPAIEPGDRVVVTLAVDGRTIARLETTAS